jgi:hypothetical protein
MSTGPATMLATQSTKHKNTSEVRPFFIFSLRITNRFYRSSLRRPHGFDILCRMVLKSSCKGTFYHSLPSAPRGGLGVNFTVVMMYAICNLPDSLGSTLTVHTPVNDLYSDHSVNISVVSFPRPPSAENPTSGPCTTRMYVLERLDRGPRLAGVRSGCKLLHVSFLCSRSQSWLIPSGPKHTD